MPTNKSFKLATVSFALVVAAIWLTLKGGSAGLGTALVLAAVAIGTGVFSLISVGPSRGKPLAIAGVLLGSGLIPICLFVLLVLPFFQSVQRQHQTSDDRVQALGSANPMPDSAATNFTSNLPIIVLETAGRRFSKNFPATVRATILEPENGYASLRGKTNYDGLGTVNLRGYSTLRLPKKSFTFHTVDAETNQTKVSLLGLPKEEDWVLYAPFEDKTLIRDVLAYELAARMGHYAPRTRYVELFINDARQPLSMRHYAGIYLLVEKIKRGKDRVNIKKLDAQDTSEPGVTGGYIIKRDHDERDEPRFHTRRGGPYFYVYPKPEDILPEQKAWLTGYLNAFESALHSDDFADPQRGYPAYLDVDSFIDAHWLVELGKNVDGFRYSAFLTKDRGGKLKMEPPWDWNRSFGNANYYRAWETKNWYWTNLRPGEISWYRRLSRDPEFARRCRERWFELRRDVLDPKRISARIDQLAAQLQEAQQRNFKRWPVLGLHVTCNYYVGGSYADEVRWLKDWIEQRIAWIDGEVAATAKANSAAPGAVNARSTAPVR